MNDLYDDELLDDLRAGFAGATYDRSVTTLRRPSRAPLLIAATAVIAVAAVGVVITSDGSRSPALAWSPLPVQAGAEAEAAARELCALPEPEPLEDPARAAAGPAGEQVPAPPPEPVLPAELPALVALDVRGNAGLATFADDQWVVSCMLLPGDDGFERGVVSVTSAPSGPAPAGMGASAVGVTVLPDGQQVGTLMGTLPEGATSVEVDLPGLATAEATVTGDLYSCWWIGTPTGAGEVRALAVDGSVVATMPLPLTGGLPVRTGPDGEDERDGGVISGPISVPASGAGSGTITVSGGVAVPPPDAASDQ